MVIDRRNTTIGLAIAGVIFLADQATKWLVDVHLGMLRGETIDLLPFFDFTRTHNYGISLGMLTAESQEMRWFLVIATSLIAAIVLFWMLREKLLGDVVALSLVLGGALGNILDRVRFGYVLDFADFHIGEFRPFLIFNVADAAITIGVVILLARALFMGEKPGDTQSETA
ncbi:Lipoprotein signal peptidase [Paraurantiacibacter namhicola]|uniref:Lipoprotein signal peptidase n=2 Tax=Paraurantiacibacter namhicola TaxID=645517 RepID=A0A1C7D5T9_9SPHN|nr:Lipoprotein signal peptidase [Paraurantiacibacter namhicola]